MNNKDHDELVKLKDNRISPLFKASDYNHKRKKYSIPDGEDYLLLAGHLYVNDNGNSSRFTSFNLSLVSEDTLALTTWYMYSGELYANTHVAKQIFLSSDIFEHMTVYTRPSDYDAVVNLIEHQYDFFMSFNQTQSYTTLSFKSTHRTCS
jgi:hypothetical protein